MPKPKNQFQRPGIVLSDGSPKKEWQHVCISEVAEGDIVTGWGRVTESKELPDSGYRLIFLNGSIIDRNPLEVVHAFTTVRNG